MLVVVVVIVVVVVVYLHENTKLIKDMNIALLKKYCHCMVNKVYQYAILETSVFEFHFLNSCCSRTVWWILLKFATFAPERR